MVTTPAPGISELLMVSWLEATLRDEQTLVSHQRDLHADIVATVANQALPRYSLPHRPPHARSSS